MTRITFCPSCRGTQIEHDAAQGTAVCVACGTVLEESTVVAEVTFAELANGSSVLQGQFISSERGKAAAPSIFGRRVDGSSSAEATIANGRRRIQAVAVAVGMSSEHYIEAAQRWYVLALQHQFTRGRRAPNIVAACLYIVCRQEKTPHMLLDFSDVLQTSVYSLGGTFLRLVRLLNLEIPLIDPSFYVGRFAARLEFGDKTQQVANTALRVVARMKRDWIQTGRRPAGVCAAGLIIAARMHGFRRTEREVVQVVHICEATLRRRLEEFGETPSSQLTPEQFEGIWLEQEADPPSFSKNKGVFRKGEEAALLLTPPYSQTAVQASFQAAFPQKDTFSDLDQDDEINSFMLAPDEIELKTRLWTSLNRDYLERVAEKERADEADKSKENVPRKRAARARKQVPAADMPAETAAEAAKQMLTTKRFSKKINYKALDELFP